MQRHRLKFLAIVLTVILAPITKASDNFFWPDAQYDPSIPTLKQIVGHDNGHKITPHLDTKRYFEALAKAAPDRVRLFPYATSWEGRELYYAVISSSKNLAKLDEFAANMQKLSDPRKTTNAQARALVKDMPASLWLSYGVHGNEISSTDAAILSAYHLLASKDDAIVDSIMDNAIVFINPMQNPDGRDRFIHRFRSAKGLVADSDPASAEHNEPWPSGRTNHYLFDMNRDWIVLTQPEIRGQVKALQKWYPLVFVDLHEMGGNSHYYFAPEAVPFNPHLTSDQRQNLFLFGKNNAKYFDKAGKRYFTRDVFDAFYPGYGASWPAYYGAIPMTYEQGSSRALVYRRNDGTDLTYKDTVKGHFLTSISTAQVVAENRQKLLADYIDYQQTAIDEGKKEKSARTYVISDALNKGSLNKLAWLLDAQGVELTQLTASTKVCGATVAAGSIVIDSAQPRKRMIRTLLEEQVDMEQDFVSEQERLRRKNFSHDIYDVTGWSLPKMFNLDMTKCSKPAGLAPTGPAPTGGTFTAAADSKVYLVPGGDIATVQLMTRALRDGAILHQTDATFGAGDQEFGRGSLIFYSAENTADLASKLQSWASETGARVTGLASTWADRGRDLGGRYVNRVHAPKIAMAWDAATNQYSAGNSRFVIEQQFGYPVTVVRTQHMAYTDLSKYDVIILPAEGWGTNYKSVLGKSGAKKLDAFVRGGGVLIAQSTAMRYLSDKDINLISARREYQVKEDVKESDKKDETMVAGRLIENADQFKTLIEPVKERPDTVPGVLLHARTDQDHWLTNGVKPTLNVLATGREIYTPVTMDNGVNAAYFNSADDIVSSGYLWDENRKQYAFKPFAIVERRGKGFVIGFTQEPTRRAYLDGLNIIYSNAIFGGSAHARPTR